MSHSSTGRCKFEPPTRDLEPRQLAFSRTICVATDTIRSGAPKNQSTIVSRHVDTEYFQRQCDLYFPKDGNFTYGSNAGRTAEDVNAVTEGWNLTDTTRLLWANGLVSHSLLLALVSRRPITTVPPLHCRVKGRKSARETKAC